MQQTKSLITDLELMEKEIEAMSAYLQKIAEQDRQISTLINEINDLLKLKGLS